MIVEIGWRVVVIAFALNCLHIQAMVHVTQVVIKTYSVATVIDHHINFGWNAIVKATVDF